MVGIMNSNSDISFKRENLLKLMENKAKLDAELLALYGVLEQNGVGMSEALVDSQGFPRNDIDVYNVRHARHKIICLRNDLKAVMRSIEEGLHAVHAQGQRKESEAEDGDARGRVEAAMVGRPIARVASVANDSPAFTAGLQPDDVIVEFGSVNSDNFKTLQDISKVVQHSVDSGVDLIVQRGNSTIAINLRPKAWAGRGVLGCTILPVENNIER